VSSAIRLARAMSKDNIPTLNQLKPQEPRGPCPGYLNRVQSNQKFVNDIDTNALQYSEQMRGLQAIYNARRQQNIAMSHNHDNCGPQYYREPAPSSRYRHYANY